MLKSGRRHGIAFEVFASAGVQGRTALRAPAQALAQGWCPRIASGQPPAGFSAALFWVPVELFAVLAGSSRDLPLSFDGQGRDAGIRLEDKVRSVRDESHPTSFSFVHAYPPSFCFPTTLVDVLSR